MRHARAGISPLSRYSTLDIADPQRFFSLSVSQFHTHSTIKTMLRQFGKRIIRSGPTVLKSPTAASIRIVQPVRLLASIDMNSDEKPKKSTLRKARKPVLEGPDFNNYEASFESKTTADLLRATGCFALCRIPGVAKYSEELLGAFKYIFGDRITHFLLKQTMYRQFVAGESVEQIAPRLKELSAAGIGCILDYVAESDGSPTTASSNPFQQASSSDVARVYSYEDEAKCDQNVNIFLKCIHDTAKLSDNGYSAVKATGFTNPKLLERMSNAIIESKNLFQKFDADLDGYVTREEFENAYSIYFNQGDRSLNDIFEEFDPQGTGKFDYITWSLKLKPADLPKIIRSCKSEGALYKAAPTEEELELIEATYNRTNLLAEAAAKTGTRLLVDAEQVKHQPAIDSLVLDLQQKYNATDRSDKPIIYNTYQAYLKDSPVRLENDLKRAKRFDFHFGAKLVRGAYLETERKLAKQNQTACPIHETLQDTHDCYNQSLDFLLKQSVLCDQQIEVMCATHNQESIEKAIAAMDKYGIDKSSNAVVFAQLYGMGDHLSFNLGKHGYKIYKYMPYGKVELAIAYLLRRLKENSAVAGLASMEASLNSREAVRRMNPLSSKVHGI